ncbi:class A sortase [Lacticaseibacillus absianus]|uniref:class A sortase n=1 Tax=Lacticaseibacillus absianus TaxID=2729623 RepID=UPI0015C69DA4|nr:class A sortase [Lacticaseibacillus absianus]
MAKRWGAVILTVGLLVSGLALSLYLLQDQLAARLIASRPVTVTVTTAAQRHQAKQAANYDFASVRPLTLAQLSQAALARHAVPAVGKLLVPDVAVALPVAEGVSQRVLAFAAGTLSADQTMGQGNYALAGHHMHTDESLLFGPLVRTRVGMAAYLTDMSTLYTYEIYGRRYIAATETAVLAATGRAELTLITCDDDGQGRLLIQARLVDQRPVTKASAALQRLINAD